MADLKAYNISFPAAEIDKLNQKLSLSTVPDELDDDSWEFGVPIKIVKRLVAHWQQNFNWQTFQAKLNELPNFEITISVEGFDPIQVHFLHQVSSVKTAIPLILVHGCTYSPNHDSYAL